MSASIMAQALKAVEKSVAGAIVRCSWTRSLGQVYEPEDGAYRDYLGTETITFKAIKGSYKSATGGSAVSWSGTSGQGLPGRLPGDIPIFVNPADVPAQPQLGDVILLAGVAHEVITATDDAGMLYTLQMRRK